MSIQSSISGKDNLSAYVKYQVWMQQNKTQQYNGYFCVSIVFQIFQDFIILCNILFFKPEELFWEVSLLLLFLLFVIVTQLYHLVADENLIFLT